jgi:cytochrome c
MKKAFILGLFGIVTFILASTAFGMDKATPQEVKAKVEEAVKLIQEKGEDAYPIIRDKNGPFVWKDSYVFISRLEGTMLVHINNKLEGRNMMGSKDATGKLFHAGMVDVLNAKPTGTWYDYQWVKPGEKTPSPKVSYLMQVPGTDVFAGAGVWDVTMEDIKKAGM